MPAVRPLSKSLWSVPAFNTSSSNKIFTCYLMHPTHWLVAFQNQVSQRAYPVYNKYAHLFIHKSLYSVCLLCSEFAYFQPQHFFLTWTTGTSPSLPTVHHASRQHHLLQPPPAPQSVHQCHPGEWEESQAAIRDGFSPECSDHLPVSEQTYPSTSSADPCSCTRCIHCENLLSASHAKKSSLTDYAGGVDSVYCIWVWTRRNRVLRLFNSILSGRY